VDEAIDSLLGDPTLSGPGTKARPHDATQISSTSARAEVLGSEWRHDRVTARALPVTGGVVHRRFDDAVGGADSRIIPGVTFSDRRAGPQRILERHLADGLAARIGAFPDA
jgi:hypothetical protein